MEWKWALICPSFEGLSVLDSGLDLSVNLNVCAFPAHSGGVGAQSCVACKGGFASVSFPVMSPALLCALQLEGDSVRSVEHDIRTDVSSGVLALTS